MSAVNSLLRNLGLGVLAVLFIMAGVRVAQAQDDELDTLNRQIVELFQAGKYAQATPMAERALALTERRLGADHPRVGARLSDLALLYRAQGRYADTEPLYKRDLAITENAFGADHALVSTRLVNLAVTYTAQGRYAEAEPLLRRALVIREQRLGDTHPETAQVLNHLAITYQSLARLGDAEAAAKRALAIQEALGASHPDVASTLNNLAVILSDRGRDAEAEALHKRSLAIREAAKGPDHPDLVPAFANLGAFYYRQGRYGDAELAMKRALSMHEAALGGSHPDLAPSLNNLAELYRAQARGAEAEPLYKRAIDILENAFGSNHPGLRGGVARVEMAGGLADLSHIKMQVPLPETADELCAVAHDVKAAARDIRLGTHATEREVKRLSASGELARYRMVHFATHGALAGELEGTREPGLILTPPESASVEDDGYLSASEIAGLKLDADWVLLSACNTAAGGADNAEALSGLARAFIYAQARALLVSHWAVDSDATVKLVTAAISEMARDVRVGRAEAVRRSMLALIDRGEPHEAHPALWAPFVVVGEGASAR